MRPKKIEGPAVGKDPRKTKVPKVLAVIDQKGCTGCHACIPFCPVDCIEQVPGEDPQMPDFMRVVEVDLDRCIGCRLCAQYCPWDTIFMLDGHEAEQKAVDWTLRSVVYDEEGSEAEPEAEDKPATEPPQDK